MPRQPGLVTAAMQSLCVCCCTARCVDEGCELRLPDSGSFKCLNGSMYQANHDHSGRLADCVVFWASGRSRIIAVVELKTRATDVRRAVSQLQAGADLVCTMLPAAQRARARFVPLLVHARISNIELRSLARLRVTFDGKRYPVSQARCGSELLSVAGATPLAR